jgi:osmotically inducible protein OsmC
MPVTARQPAARQPGLRPETIRTRLARFMPARAGTGWSVTWSSHTEHRDEIGDEEELRAAEHLGCFGAALAHTLGQAGAAPRRLRLTVEAAATLGETEPTALVVEVRAQIPGMDQAIFETVARRVESTCPVWKALAGEVGMRVVPILEESQAVNAEAAAPSPAAAKTTVDVQTPGSRPDLLPGLGSGVSVRPAWLTPKIGLALAGILVVGARVWSMFGA